MTIPSLVTLGCLLSLGGTALAREHYVFAHYMVCMPYNGAATVEAYKQQIRLAQQYGIDGFALNCGAWANEPYYIERSIMIYEAARQLDSGFKLFFSLDTATRLDPLPTALDMLGRFGDHPNQFRHEGKPVLSAYSGPSPRWAETIPALKAAGHAVCFVPFFWTANHTLAPSYDGVLNSFADAPYLDGYFLFGTDAPAWDLVRGNANGRRATAKLGKLYMATASFSYNSANLRDYQGMRGYSALWEGIIRDNADWVEIVTWNDYNEDSHLAPAHGTGDLAAVNHDEAYLAVTAYYAAWFKTGVAPTIRQDRLFVTYRNQSKWQATAYDEQQGAWVSLPDQVHDDVEDKVYATTFLTAPAVLTIQCGKARKRFKLAAGVSHVDLPASAGVPRFTLTRGGAVLTELTGSQPIIGQPTPLNSPWKARQANKTWNSSWSSGEGRDYAAAQGMLLKDAVVKQSAGRETVSLRAGEGCGVRWTDVSWTPGAANVRVRYRNAEETPCRLTLTATSGEVSAVFPVFLPPSGRAFRTVAFQWTPPGVGGTLSLTRVAGEVGEVEIEGLTLVPVLPFTVDRTSIPPALVAIPGGAFTMGTATGDPDEAPAHPVTVSPFRMSRYEVTNAEFERFDPAHRRYRDDYSWRDTEPVIYVSWQQAARYCNWLSERAGLPPAYDLTTWAVNLHAGYRLPTEAEWEYVASGRGEGRIYPWGSEAPDASRCNADGTGTTPVGSFPLGASRDGVLDLAGNVAEWCTDCYHPYLPAAVVDPCNLTPGRYRVIRGGSWGYYGRSQRVADREFNTQVYPGYYYVGFRVVVPGK
jgi:glucan endo-1,3-alpha-glucosidase